MTVQEKCAWISVVSILVVSGYYFWELTNFDYGIDIHSDQMDRVLKNVIVLGIVTYLISYYTKPKVNPFEVEEDERDFWIKRKANKNAFIFLVLLIIGFILAIALNVNEEINWFSNFSPLDVAHGLLGALFVSGLVKYLSEIFYYRNNGNE